MVEYISKLWFFTNTFYFDSWKVAILKILVCTMNSKPCFSSWNFPIMILHGISTIAVNWFNSKLLSDLPRKLFTILELSRRCILFTILLAQLLTTYVFKNIQRCSSNEEKPINKKIEKIYNSDQEGPWNSNLVVLLNEHVRIMYFFNIYS